MNKVQGLHHLALTTANITEQIEFFTGKLGMELAALYWMHGVKNTWHGCSGLIKPDTNQGDIITISEVFNEEKTTNKICLNRN
jgi:catechol 2,3-dioxygenase-like lactoylglutathione lyase family enzyme